MRIFQSAQGALVEREESAALPGLTAESVTRFLNAGRALDRLTWLGQLRTWVPWSPGGPGIAQGSRELTGASKHTAG
jgi:hypothetical protein